MHNNDRDSVLDNAKNYMDDAGITVKVKAEFLNEPLIKSLEIHVETNDGVVTLTGKVPSQAAFDKARAIAQSTQGVRSVITSLDIQP